MGGGLESRRLMILATLVRKSDTILYGILRVGKANR